MTSSTEDTIMGILWQPGDLRIFWSSFIVPSSTLTGHMSIFVITMNTGTFKARASPRCSEGSSAKWVV